MSAPPDADLPAQRFARALLTGSVGFLLFHELAEQFPDIRRQDVFFGCALAWTDLQAGLLAAEVEVRALREQLAARDTRRTA